MKWNQLRWAAFAFFVTLLFLQFSVQMNAYVNRIQQGGGLARTFAEPVGTERDELLKRIHEEAKKRYIPPIDAKLDRVWKAIPGYNGLRVNVEATYRLFLQKQNEKNGNMDGEIPFVYEEVPPKVGLEQLGPYPIYKGNPHKPMASLMINVAWGNEHIPSILETLEKENVRATFFFDGSWLKKNPDVAKRICSAGHECANHAYSHKNMSRLGRQQAEQEIMRTQELLKTVLGIENNRLFAPPAGDFSGETVRIAYELGLYTVLWTVDTVDWKHPSPEWIIRRIRANVEPGSLILMHPTPSSSRALAEMIREIKKKGLVLGTVSELLSPRRIPPVEQPFIF